MRKLLLVLASAVVLSASQIEWAQSYDDAVEQAAAKKKNVFVVISRDNCRWCKKLKELTLTDPAVVDRISRDYVAVEVMRGVDDYPEYLQAPMVPMSYFLYPDGSMIMRGMAGYWNVEDYISILDDADYKIKKKRRLENEANKTKP